MAEDLY